MKRWQKGLFFGVLGTVLYPIGEIIWRGRTHISMAFAGGLSAFLIYLALTSPKIPSLFWRATLGAAAVTGVEFLFGAVCNLWLGLGVWDYRKMPYQLLGQICLPFSLLWWGICFVLGIGFMLFRKIPPLSILDKEKKFDYNENDYSQK